MTRISRRARAHIKPSIYLHNTIAMSLNVFTVLTAFKFLPKWFFFVLFLISLFVSYRFAFNYRSYSFFDFEALYFWLKKKSQVQVEKSKQRKEEQPSQYYNHLIRYFSETFPGVHFEYRLQKKRGEEDFIEGEGKSILMKKVKRIGRNIKRTVLFWRYPGAAERFVQANDGEYLRYVKAEYW